MKLIIDIPEMTLLNITSRELLLCSREDIEKLEFAINNGTPIPDNATNGDIMNAMFSNAKIVKTDKEVFLYTGTRKKDEDIQIFDTEWWNATYRKGGK